MNIDKEIEKQEKNSSNFDILNSSATITANTKILYNNGNLS